MLPKLLKLSVAFFWVLLFVSALVTVVLNTSLAAVTSNEIAFVNFFQRFTGLTAFSLFIFQLSLGVAMEKYVKLFGGKMYALHVKTGITLFFLVLLHPLFELLMRYQIGRLASFFVLDLGSRSEIAILYGKIAWFLVVLAVFAGFFRSTFVFLRRYWRLIHLANYLAFAFIIIHAKGLGSDVTLLPFAFFFNCAISIYSLLVLVKLSGLVRKSRVV